MYAANQNTQEVKRERFLTSTRQNNVHIFGKFCLRQSDERTNRYKHELWEILSFNVTFADRRSKAPTLAKIEFGKKQQPRMYVAVKANCCLQFSSTGD